MTTTAPTRRARLWRRRLLRAALCLLLGAVTTVGVAWGVVLAPTSYAHGVTIAGGGQTWAVGWRGSSAYRVTSAFCLGPTRPRGVEWTNPPSVDDVPKSLAEAAEATFASLPVDDLVTSPLMQSLGVRDVQFRSADRTREIPRLVEAGWPLRCLYGINTELHSGISIPTPSVEYRRDGLAVARVRRGRAQPDEFPVFVSQHSQSRTHSSTPCPGGRCSSRRDS